MFQTCPFHGSEDVPGIPTGDSDGSVSFTCSIARNHPDPGHWSWLYIPEPASAAGATGLAAELGLEVELRAALGTLPRQWVEYGLVERAYAVQRPDDFARIVEKYGHVAIAPARYTASAYVARVLGVLSRRGQLLYRRGEATGWWGYNGNISWWALAPEPNWEDRISWVETGNETDYVPGRAAD